MLDRDGNGFISKQELGMAMRSLGYMPSEVELAIIMQRLDMDGESHVHTHTHTHTHTGKHVLCDADVLDHTQTHFPPHKNINSIDVFSHGGHSPLTSQPVLMLCSESHKREESDKSSPIHCFHIFHISRYLIAYQQPLAFITSSVFHFTPPGL